MFFPSTESLSAVVECFRIALENAGRIEVPFITGGNLQKLKSRSLLGVSQGIPRNLSESQLVQTLSNVAGQFSKLGQTLNIKGKKIPNLSRHNGNPSIVYNAPLKDDNKKIFNIGKGAMIKDEYSSESDENDCSIYEPDSRDLVQSNPIYNENNDFLPSVGIVMSSGNGDQNIMSQPNIYEHNKIIKRLPSDISSMSISSIADYVPPTMRSCSPTPEIRIQSIEHDNTKMIHSYLQSGHSFSKSSNEVKLETRYNED